MIAETSRPQPLLFRGHLPEELSPAQRLALLDRMQKTEPDDWQRLQANPALHAAMRQGTDGLPVPDWRAEGEW
ncbi:MAG: hypothetical protein M5U25_20230 [Planctomycetota bacterium]|nr:hypothetical protein [Planctomycetota bacterium]